MKESPIDIHKYDYLVKHLSNRFMIILISIVAILMGMGFSIQLHEPGYMNRFGGVVAILGLLLTMSPFFLNGIYKSQSACGRWAGIDSSGNLLTTTQAERLIGDNVFFGVVISIIGTLINCFGDLIF
ncbi:hypothetical protein [Acinetobacter sp. YH12145]|uniref:hypothetical protein n=1 Tax=Acinetobacter sp. YH12145 TaxID=2601129 RepID=UPI0015D3F77A|nr:hypothetical protein [Acinetobacter sp. YH12145]